MWNFIACDLKSIDWPLPTEYPVTLLYEKKPKAYFYKILQNNIFQIDYHTQMMQSSSEAFSDIQVVNIPQHASVSVFPILRRRIRFIVVPKNEIRFHQTSIEHNDFDNNNIHLGNGRNANTRNIVLVY